MNLSKQDTYPISHFLTPDKEYNHQHIAYLAGYFDGEGCISDSGYFRLAVVSGDLSSIELFQTTFGGRIVKVPMRSSPQRVARVQTYGWYAGGTSCLEPLRVLLPYLRAKKTEAETILNAPLRYCIQGKAGRVSAEQKAIRWEVSDKIRSLKKWRTQ